MTISTQINKVSYEGNGVTTEFLVPYKFVSNQDIRVVLASSGVETSLVLGTHYTLAGAGVSSGGVLTMLTPPATGETLVIRRSPTIVQELDYVEDSVFPAETDEAALDLLTMICQDLQEQLDRSVKMPISSEGSPDEFISNIAINVAHDSAVFDVAEYIRKRSSAQLDAVQNAKFADQDPDLLLAALREAGDDAITYLQNSGSRGAKILLPSGNLWIKDEVFSTDTQTAIWNQSNLNSSKALIIAGRGRAVSRISIHPDWLSCVRNTLNGNERDFGPWSGGPSPSILFWALCNNVVNDTVIVPMSISFQDFSIEETGTIGKDPIPYMYYNALGVQNSYVKVTNAANHGEIICGCYNSDAIACEHENCGHQPLEGGSIMGNAPGYPPTFVRFDMTSGDVITLTAKAGYAFGTYAAGDAVPFFHTAHVGKSFILSLGAKLNGASMPCKGTITAVGGDGSSTATFTPPVGVPLYNDGNNSGLGGSFAPVKFTSVAGSQDITLSDPIRIGRGAADMLGQIVMLPKARSTAVSTRDILCTRIVACTVGNDVNGYTGLRLANAPADSVTDYFVYTAAHNTAIEETLAGNSHHYSDNDFDHFGCRWEAWMGFNGNPRMSACQFLAQAVSGASQYVGCKVHGAGNTNDSFASELNAIIDDAQGLHFVGCDFTHMTHTGKGQVRMMGANGKARFTGTNFLGSAVDYDTTAVYLDPQQTGFNANRWSVVVSNPMVKSDIFPTASQAMCAGASWMTNTQIFKAFSDNRLPLVRIAELTSADNLDDQMGPFHFGSSKPTNSPWGLGYGWGDTLTTTAGTAKVQRVWSTTAVPGKVVEFSRLYTPATLETPAFWNSFQLRSIVPQTTAQLSSATGSINASGKFAGLMVFNTTLGKPLWTSGANATDPWKDATGTTVITPA